MLGKWKWQAKFVSLCEELNLFRLFCLNQRRAVRDAERAATMILLLKNIPKAVFMSGFSMMFKYHLKVFPFLYIKTNSKEICKGAFFPFWSEKWSAFLLTFKAMFF